MRSESKYVLPLFVVDEGCPFRCIYCDQKKVTGQTAADDPEKIRERIEEQLSFFRDKTKEVKLCFFGGSFTGIRQDKMTMYLDIAEEYIKKGLIHEIGLSTRPDLINENILNTLRQYHVTTIELGAQSLVDDILISSKRGHDLSSVSKAVKTIKDYGFLCGLQLMPGLPGETDETIRETTKKAVEMEPDIARIYPLLVLKGTELEKMYDRGEYTPLTLDKAVEYSEHMLRCFVSKGIKVIRIGLQNSPEITLGKEVAAGPFFEAFGQLVLSRYILKNVLSILKKYDKIYDIEIRTGKGMGSAARGYKNENLGIIEQKTGTKDIKITETTMGRYYTGVCINGRGEINCI
jgi:histone acetyltransferase (RNA polymerase elongator complex component)